MWIGWSEEKPPYSASIELYSVSLLELHRYCISHFARVSSVSKWSYGQECNMFEKLCNAGLSTWSQACAPLGNSVTMKFDMSILGGFVKISGNEPMDNWLNSAGRPLPLQKVLAKVGGAWDPCHDNIEAFLGHMAQTQTCNCPSLKQSPINEGYSLVRVHATNRLPFLKHLSVAVINLLMYHFHTLLWVYIWMLVQVQVHSCTCVLDLKASQTLNRIQTRKSRNWVKHLPSKWC